MISEDLNEQAHNTKICSNCHVTKNDDQFHKKWSACKACRADYDRLRRYKITPQEWTDLVLDQSGECAICKKFAPDVLVVDHDHDTGKVRGLLCSCCNRAIGQLKDSIGNLARAIVYLNEDPEDNL